MLYSFHYTLNNNNIMQNRNSYPLYTDLRPLSYSKFPADRPRVSVRTHFDSPDINYPRQPAAAFLIVDAPCADQSRPIELGERVGIARGWNSASLRVIG